MKVVYAPQLRGKSKLPSIIKQYYKPKHKPKHPVAVWIDDCTD